MLPPVVAPCAPGDRPIAALVAAPIAVRHARSRALRSRELCLQLATLVLICACEHSEAAQSGAVPKHPEPATGSSTDGFSPGKPRSAAKSVLTEADALEARADLPPEARALVVVDGKERWVDAEAIESGGYTLIDLRDDWTPYIFAEQHTPEGELLPNRYRRVFIGLANDRLDSDGEPLEPGEKNYLELYGVFPSLSVLRARFLEGAAHPCHDQESVSVLEAVETVTYIAPKDVKRKAQRITRMEKDLEAQRRRAKVATLEELIAQKPGLSAKLELVQKEFLSCESCVLYSFLYFFLRQLHSMRTTTWCQRQRWKRIACYTISSKRNRRWN
jgi:hypothetical protein